ncbi:TetR/AcrR family transcriptional regulator [Lentzea sp. NBRC 102530]|uniref:TetR/AcrR family transcriptional regulator n=1 Tax=Lentzea sp. NBRC 102530 TaxID=3032201 RepID=UPI0024A482A1|nr:TetR/AcrR family transcriptional regulator [Lentzea sp. NBRC 102530]GLY52835.1 TetR family transcriptional regulator [Lentzea sp. NBRC 102530]
MGLRERKKTETRAALSAAALRLALEKGVDEVRVDEIAEAANVSPRTYNNYFPSREHAIVAGITASRALEVAEALRSRPHDEPLVESIIAAFAEQYREPPIEALALITSTPALREAYLDSVTSLEPPIVEVIAARLGTSERGAEVLAAAVSAAARLAVQRWVDLRPSGLVVVGTASVEDHLREAIGHLAPVLR